MPDNLISITRPPTQPVVTQKNEAPKYPTEIISLPSQGFPYDANHPLSSGTLELKNLTAKEENLLTNQTLLKNGTLLDKLLESVIVDKSIKPDSMLMCDFDASIFALRRMAYGDNYDVTITCPKCGKDIPVEIDLSQMKNIDLNESFFVKGENNFSFELPYSKRMVTFKLLTRKDVYNIDKEIEGLKKAGKQSTEMTTRLSYIITSVDGETETSKIRKFVNGGELISKDSLELRKHIKEISPRLDSTFEFSCSNCDLERKQEVPMDMNFFWPK
jgi:hypothetical protein